MAGNLSSVDKALEPDTDKTADMKLELGSRLYDLLEKGKTSYLGEEISGMDRGQEKIAKVIEEYNPENSYVQGLTDFSKGITQGVGGIPSAPGAIYDGIKEWHDDEYEISLSLYDQIERHNDEKSILRKAGEAVGFTAGAAAGLQYPPILLAGLGQSARHLAERKLHEKAKHNFYDEEQTAS